MAHSVEDRNLKLRKRRENVFIAKPEASNTFLIKRKQSMIGFKTIDYKKVGEKSTFVLT